MSNRSRALTDEFEYTGLWRLPDNPDVILYGTLKCSPENMFLTLIGAFDNPQLQTSFTLLAQGQSRPHSSLKIILGTEVDGEPITLLDCFLTHRNSPMHGYEISKYRVMRIFIGKHFEKLDDIKFKSVSIHYSYLNEWSGKSGFHVKDINEKEMIIEFDASTSLEYDIDAKFRLKVNHSIYDASNLLGNEISMKTRVYLSVKSQEKIPYAEFAKIHGEIRNFLTLAIMHPVFQLMIEADIDGNPSDKNVIIFYNTFNLPKTFREIYPDKMLFTLREVSENFQTLLTNWHKIQDDLGDVTELYFSTLYNSQLYPHNTFQAIVAGLEAYHRRRFTTTSTEPSEYETMVTEILSKIDDKDHKKWIERLAKYGNEPSLQRRMLDLLDKFPYAIDESTNKTCFVDDIMNTRNYHAHHTSDLKVKAVHGDELFYLTQKMKVLLESCLLSELGLSEDKLKPLILKSRSFKNEFRILRA